MNQSFLAALAALSALSLLSACSSPDPGQSSSGTAGSAGSGGSAGQGGTAGAAGAAGQAGSGGQAGGSGGQAGSGGSGGAPVTLLLKEDFESSTEGMLPDPAVWKPAIAGNGTLVVASDRAHGGKKSLHVTSPSGSYETFVQTSAPFPVENNTFWGRLFFYVESNMPKNFVHWTVMEARGVESNNRVRYGGINNADGNGFYGNWFLLNVETQGMGEIAIDDDPKPVVPAGEWICMEWYYAGKAGANEARLFWNGEERPKLHAMNDFFHDIYAMPTFDRLYIGWAIYQNIDMPYQVWIDDIAIGKERVGCQ